MSVVRDQGGVVRIIAGSGRSGTTWVQDVLADANNMRAIFEPLKTVSKRVPCYEYAFLQENDRADDLKGFLDQVFDGQFRSVWSDYRIIPSTLIPNYQNVHSWSSFKSYVRRLEEVFGNWKVHHKKLGNPQIIVKFIRANLMLEWLQRQFDVKAIFVIRHPGAVIESQLRLGGESWDPFSRLNYYRNDKLFMSKFEGRYGKILAKTLSRAEANALIWCIENQYPVERSVVRGYPVISYESLIRSPGDQWERVIKALALDHVPDMLLLERPSQQASDGWKLAESSKPKQAGWMLRLTDQELQEIANILKQLGVDYYQMDDSRPKIDF